MQDITYDNGVIQTIDSVLLPPNDAVITAYEMGFLYFYGALERTGLASDITAADQVTLFVPRDQAFVDVGSALQDLDSTQLETIIAFHAVVDGVHYSINLSDSDTLNTLAQTDYTNSLDITVDENDGALYVNNARVITPNILLKNGVAHLIDEVLNPENDDDAYGFDYSLDGADGEGVEAFESASSATIPALTSGIAAQTSTFTPTATFSAVSGADNSHKHSFFTLIAAGLGLLVI